MTSRALVLAAAALAVSLSAYSPAWAAKAKKATPAKPRPAATAPAAKARPVDDQSYLQLSPGSAAPAGPPDWVTSGAKRSNQPWANTQFDWWGDFSAR